MSNKEAGQCNRRYCGAGGPTKRNNFSPDANGGADDARFDHQLVAFDDVKVPEEGYELIHVDVSDDDASSMIEVLTATSQFISIE